MLTGADNGESDCLITLWSKQEILPFNAVRFCANPWSDFMEWIHDEYSVVEKRAQTMLQLLDLVCVVYFGKPGELEQIVNISVSQIVEGIAEVNIPVPQVVEEIAEVSKSLIVWSSIPKLYFGEIEVFPA